MPASRELHMGKGPSASRLCLSETELLLEHVMKKKSPLLRTELRNVIWAEIAGGVISLDILVKKNPKAALRLEHMSVPISKVEKDSAADFVEDLMDAAYSGVPKRRRIKLFINPHSGPGKSVAHFRKKVEPILKAARCEVDVTITTHRNHAAEVMANLDLSQFDAVAVMSGDGLVHEVFNGCAHHADPVKAFKMPVAPIPTGSGNGLALNLLGIKHAKDVAAAALNVIKGKPMSIDLFSILQGGKRYISFMCQSLGLMANCDLGTEPLRILGEKRFVIGFIYEVLFKYKPVAVKVSMKVAHSDKSKMFEDMQVARSGVDSNGTPSTNTQLEDRNGLPALQHIGPDASQEGWTTFETPFTYMLAGKGPYVTSDFIQFPVSLPDDGMIDVVFQELTTRRQLLKAISGAERGEPYWMDMQHYYKAYAYRIEPMSKYGFLSIDGEAFPLEPYELEVHRNLGTLLSMYGRYNVEFDLLPPKVNTQEK